MNGLLILRVALGMFFLAQALTKLSWVLDSGPLVGILTTWLQQATSWNRWYLEGFALPAAPVFARLVAAGEMLTAIALVSGVCVRPAASAAFVMVLNFHVASGALFQPRVLNNAFVLPVLGSLLAIALTSRPAAPHASERSSG